MSKTAQCHTTFWLSRFCPVHTFTLGISLSKSKGRAIITIATHHTRGLHWTTRRVSYAWQKYALLGFTLEESWQRDEIRRWRCCKYVLLKINAQGKLFIVLLWLQQQQKKTLARTPPSPSPPPLPLDVAVRYRVSRCTMRSRFPFAPPSPRSPSVRPSPTDGKVSCQKR